MSESQPPPPPTPPPTGGPGTPVPPPAGGGGSPPKAGQPNTLMLILAYCGPLALIPLVAETGDREVQWHAKNGLVLFGAEAIAMTLFWGVTQFIPLLNCLGCLAAVPVTIALVALHVVAIVKATGGQRFRVPVVSGLAEQL